MVAKEDPLVGISQGKAKEKAMESQRESNMTPTRAKASRAMGNKMESGKEKVASPTMPSNYGGRGHWTGECPVCSLRQVAKENETRAGGSTTNGGGAQQWTRLCSRDIDSEENPSSGRGCYG